MFLTDSAIARFFPASIRPFPQDSAAAEAIRLITCTLVQALHSGPSWADSSRTRGHAVQVGPLQNTH
jgi:hypothetical protein